MSASGRTLIVDADDAARRSLQSMLARVNWIGAITEARAGDEALESLRTQHPDLVFLEVNLPVMSGLDALAQSGSNAVVIFTTATDTAAIDAFDLGAADYLLKPFGRARLALALKRARVQLTARAASHSSAEITLADSHADSHSDALAAGRDATRPVTRVFVRTRRAVIPVDARAIVRCEAAGDYVRIYTGKASHDAYLNLRDLAQMLDSSRFVRVHRSHLINLDFVASIPQRDANRLEVVMKDGTRIGASRAGTRKLRAHMRWPAARKGEDG